MVKVTRSFLKNLWDLTIKVCRKAQIPLYRKTHDPKIFTTVQKIFLYLMKIKRKLTLRDLVDELLDSNIVDYIRLPRVPNFSTLSYFLTSLPSRVLMVLDEAVQHILPAYDSAIIDSTGFECTHPSHYYCTRINTPYPVDGFYSLHAVIDQRDGYVRSCKTSAKKIHDAITLRPLVKKLKQKLRVLYADRGYDSEKNYKFLVEKLDCTPLILQKNILKPLEKCKGKYRREIREVFDYGEYLKRNKIEGIFSTIKRKYGSNLTTKGTSNQQKELALKIILYNLEKKTRTVYFFILRRITFQQNEQS